MSGQAGARGYLLQALICVLDGLDEEHDWLSVTIEPNNESEKVDIAWTYEKRSKVVQVKSSQNQIDLPSATRWAQDLEQSTTADEYELRLLGPCSKSVASSGRIGSVLLPTPASLDIQSLIQQAAHRLDRYLSAKEPARSLPPLTREIVVEALSHRLGTYSTEGQELSRTDLDRLLDSWATEFQGTDLTAHRAVAGDLRITYAEWVHQTSSTFYVPGLNVTMPIEDAWIQLKVMEDDKLIVGTKSSLDEQFQNYIEFGQRLRTTSSGSAVASDSIPLTHPRSVLVGGPGDGKSTMLKRFAWRLSKEQAIVVRVRLPVVQRNILAGRSFEEAVRLDGFGESGITDADATQLLNSAEYLFCDGLDECDPHRAQIAERIFRWGVGHSDCRICVATRPVGHETALLPEFTHFALQPPDDHQVRELSRKLFEKSAGNGTYVAKWQEFLEGIDAKNEARHVQQLASRNPLLLGFLIRLSLDGVDIGEMRSELYARIFDIIARTRPNDREAVELNERIASEVANALAWKHSQTPFCPSDETMRFVSEHLRKQFNLDILEADEKAKAGVRFWEERRLLETITAGHEAKTFFIHLTLQEFAAARYARSLESSEFADWIRQVRRKAAWKQVVLLLSGIDDDARTTSALLDLDEPDNPVSCEALLAAEALFERDPPGLAVLPRLLESLAIRFQSDVPLISIEAAQQLARLAPYAKPQVLAISQVETLNAAWTDLGKLLLRLLTDDATDTVEEFKEWFKTYSPVLVHLSKLSPRDESQQIPEEGRDLQNQIIECGLERMIASHDAKDIAEYFEEIGGRGNLSAGLTSTVQQRLVDIGLPETAKALWSPNFDTSMISGMQAASLRWRKGDSNLLKLIVRASGTTTGAKGEPPFLALSVLISGLQYWESAAGTLATLKDVEPSEDNVGAEVIRGLAFALQLDTAALGAEAQAALEYCTEHESAMYNVVERATAEADWSKLTLDDFDPDLISQGILHPCSLIGLCAANVILSGFGKSEAAKLIPTALESDSEHTIWHAAAIAEACLGADALDVCLSRLERPLYAAHKCLFRVMAQHSQAEQRQSVVESFFSWLTVDNPELATGIAEYLSEFDPPLGFEVVGHLRESLAHWTERGTKCEKHNIAVKGSSCPECYVVPPSPRSAIVKELIRLGDVSFDELIELCSDPRHDVSDLAKGIVVERAAADTDTFSSVLDRVEADQLSPRILDSLLKLPIEKDSAVAKKVEKLLHASDLGLRLATIGQLTGEWIDHDWAIEYLRTSLADSEPTIRTLAIRILRLLD